MDRIHFLSDPKKLGFYQTTVRVALRGNVLDTSTVLGVVLGCLSLIFGRLSSWQRCPISRLILRI